MSAPALVAVTLGLALAVSTDAAAAATVKLRDLGGETAVSFTAAAGERNDISMSRGASWLVQDLAGNPLTIVPPCTATVAGIGTAASCPGDRVDFATADLGDGSDHVSLAMLGSSRGVMSGGAGSDGFFGSQGNDELDGGPGDDRIDAWQGMDKLVGGAGLDTLIGGEGGDLIDGADGERDEIECGPGPDRVLADRIDAVAADCEDVVQTTQAPTAVTVIAGEVTRTTALLAAVVNPRGFSTEVRFEFGPIAPYGSRAMTASIHVGSGQGDVVVTMPVSGLSPGTTYRFRAVATSVQGTSYGVYSSFVTQRAQRACVVPSLRGRSLPAARAALARSGCRLGRVERVRSRAPRGTVVAQRPRPGMRLRAGARVGLLLSRGWGRR